MPAARRTVPLLLRLTPEERTTLDAAALEDGLPLGTWIRSVAVKEARKRPSNTRKAPGPPEG